MATGNTGLQQNGLPTVAPIGAIATTGTNNQQSVVIGKDTSGNAIWSSDPTAIANAQSSASGSATGSNSSGVVSTLGGGSSSSTIPTAPTPVDPTTSENDQINGLTSSNASTVAALQEQEAAALAQTQQSQGGETAGYAQTAATLQGIGGISSLWTGFFSNLNEAHENTLNSLKAQYDSAIATANGTLASQIATIQANTLAAQQQQQQQFFENSMSVYNAQTALVQQQVTNSQTQQGIDIQKQSLSDQEKQTSITNANNVLNSILPTLEGTGWSNLSNDQQQQLIAAGQSAGISSGIIQSLVNTKSVASTATTTDIWGNSTLTALDKNGDVIRQINLGGGFSPDSVQGQSLLAGMATQTTLPDGTQVSYVDKSTLPSGSEGNQLINAYGASGTFGKVLTAAQAQTVGTITTSLGYLDNISESIGSDNLLAANSPSLVGGYLNRTLEQALQITGASNDPNDKKINNDLNTLGSLNDELVGAVKTVAAAGGGSIGGMGLGSILKVNSQSGISTFIDPGQTVQTIQTNIANLQQALNTELKNSGAKLTGGSSSGSSLSSSDTSALNAFTSSLSNGQ